MVMQSLQNIIKIENELHASEQGEQAKIEQWVKDRKAEIVEELRAKQDDLKDRKEKIKNETREQAEEKAAAIIRSAEKRAASLAEFDNAPLVRCLHKHLTSILSGNFP